MRKLTSIFLISLTLAIPAQGFAFDFKLFKPKQTENRSYIYLVGSSTISPFMTAVSEEFSRSRYLKNIPTKTPHVESAGTRNGFISFCEGIGTQHPDFVSASRPIEPHEIESCKGNGVKGITKIKIGYDGIILGSFKGSKHLKLTKEQLFLALAQKVIDKKTKKLVANPYNKWNDIDKSLPNKEIKIYGPPVTSGTRDVFVDVVMQNYCANNIEFARLLKNKKSRNKQCAQIRTDGKFIESGENDNLIVQNLKNNPNSFGILGFNFMVVNQNIIQAAHIDNVAPSFDTIASKEYQLSRPLFVYFKKEHLALTPQMGDFIKELINSETIGKKGYLTHNGLVPLTNDELNKIRKDILFEI